MTCNDKHETVYASYKCYFWWQRGIKTKLKAKGGRGDQARESGPHVTAFRGVPRSKKQSLDEKVRAALTGVPVSSGENSTIKATIMDYRSQVALCTRAVFLSISSKPYNSRPALHADGNSSTKNGVCSFYGKHTSALLVLQLPSTDGLLPIYTVCQKGVKQTLMDW